MRLVFYSEILTGNSRLDRDVYELIGKEKPRIGYIESETDEKRKYFQEVKDYYGKYGFSEFLYFDLDREYGSQTKVGLANCDAIHLAGGNTYHFLHHIKRRNFIHFLRDYAKDKGVLIGVSAGAIIMTPTITITTLFKVEPEDENRLGLKDFSALNLVDFELFPHFDDADKREKLKNYSKKTHRLIYACKDGGGIIISGKKAKFYGEVKSFLKGKLFKINKRLHL